jgi:hypothetical protein
LHLEHLDLAHFNGVSLLFTSSYFFLPGSPQSGVLQRNWRKRWRHTT